MEGQILLVDGTSAAADADAVRRALQRAEPFWLDLPGLDDEALALLGDDMGIHPLALEDAVKFGQRPKLEEYGNYVHLVVHGAKDDASGTIEVHAFTATPTSSPCTATRSRSSTPSGRGQPRCASTARRAASSSSTG
ncbi:MAG TPA: CorA family divalent cation transporter [Acidimicrobiales bacterium]|nr:CorA family divalent cation transporter [Acidimicrobiales bacterium]